PVVASDINGDGLANDRAFVFDPAATQSASDSALAGGLRSLLASAPANARRCLARQLGIAAARNSCEGPWTSTMSASITSSYLHVLDGRYVVASLDFSNPLAGLDELLHGGDHLRGWGLSAVPDPTLYTVRGFDPASGRFEYLVNPRFGSTSPAASTLRAPFRVTLDLRVELGRPYRQKSFERFLEMAPLQQNHAPAPADTLSSRLSDEVGNYYDALLRLRDSLLLTPPQVRALAAANSAYQLRAKPVWDAIATYIESQRGHYDVNDIAHRVDDGVTRVLAIEREEIPRMRAVMTPGQLELVDIILAPLANSAKRRPPRPFLF
ncbi:MAG: hypothetical protein ACREMU_06010, partial [Gemmatimonadaceae bacterium]